MKDILRKYRASEENLSLVKRKEPLYLRNNDIRSEFERDYTRILHSNAYRRLKHKTQVFFSPQSDHICTRSEHVSHVESVSYSIANFLGLNTELTKAIAIAHDLGHSPFGHQGEKILSEISQKELGEKFWHEQNGLYLVDKVELLEDNLKNKNNLNLTYAVRDGIISHCGEIDENMLKPRKEYIDLNEYDSPNKFAPYTWEACVVKIADKISYLGRDIEDAISLGIIDEQLKELYSVLDVNLSEKVINNTVIINNLVYDLCKNTSEEKGLCFSSEVFYLINKLKKFNYENIYLSSRLEPSNRYFRMVITEIYNILRSTFERGKTLENIEKNIKIYPTLFSSFKDYISNYWNLKRDKCLKNQVLFDLESEKEYIKAIITYISGMTDNFAIDIYNEIIRF